MKRIPKSAPKKATKKATRKLQRKLCLKKAIKKVEARPSVSKIVIDCVYKDEQIHPKLSVTNLTHHEAYNVLMGAAQHILQDILKEEINLKKKRLK